MKGYAEREIFTPLEMVLFEKARELVELCPYEIDGEAVRCHELARAVRFYFGETKTPGGNWGVDPLGETMRVVDGKFGSIEHSWITLTGFHYRPSILDVYRPGMCPQVQLIDTFPGLCQEYKKASIRTDVRYRDVATLLRCMGVEPPAKLWGPS